MSAKQTLLLTTVGIGALFALMWIGNVIEGDRYKELIPDMKGFQDLGKLAEQMIAENGSGIHKSADSAYIASFQDFFNYVAKQRPHDVSSPTSPNPFPGILAGGTYFRSTGQASDLDQLLVWSDRHAWNGVRLELHCEGRTAIERVH